MVFKGYITIICYNSAQILDLFTLVTCQCQTLKIKITGFFKVELTQL